MQTGEDGISLPDPVAMSVALDPTIGTEWSSHFVDVETHSDLTRGMTVVDRLNVTEDDRNREVWRGTHKANVCWTIESKKWKEALFRAPAVKDCSFDFPGAGEYSPSQPSYRGLASTERSRIQAADAGVRFWYALWNRCRDLRIHAPTDCQIHARTAVRGRAAPRRRWRWRHLLRTHVACARA